MSAEHTIPDGLGLEATISHLRRVLRGFSFEFDTELEDVEFYRIKVPLTRMPLPVYARQLMDLIGAPYLGRGDKVAWRYGFKVDDVPCVLSSEKPGARLYIHPAVGDDDAALRMADRILDKLAAAQKTVIKSVISPQIPSQIQAGNVIFTNQYANLHGGYQYFREGCQLAYAGDGRLADKAPWIELLTGRGSQEAWWNLFAMVSAYFSLFEHILIACLPFTSFDPQADDLPRAVGGKWNEKFRLVANLQDTETAKQFAALHDIAERYRNTYSHGAFGSGGKAAMIVRLPKIGDVPASLGDFGVHPEQWFIPAAQEDFARICEAFDSCDQWLATGPLAIGYQWAQAGLDFDFSPRLRTAAAKAIERGDFEGFLRRAVEHDEALMNWEF